MESEVIDAAWLRVVDRPRIELVRDGYEEVGLLRAQRLATYGFEALTPVPRVTLKELQPALDNRGTRESFAHWLAATHGYWAPSWAHELLGALIRWVGSLPPTASGIDTAMRKAYEATAHLSAADANEFGRAAITIILGRTLYDLNLFLIAAIDRRGGASAPHGPAKRENIE